MEIEGEELSREAVSTQDRTQPHERECEGRVVIGFYGESITKMKAHHNGTTKDKETPPPPPPHA